MATEFSFCLIKNIVFLFIVQNDNTKPIPRFYRLRLIKIVDGKFASCTCGLPARKKYPCRHIIAIFGSIHPSMFSVRWLSQYQHSFERPGKDTLTKIFREMEDEQFNRNLATGEHILVEGLLNKLPLNKYPQPIGTNTTVMDIEEALKLKYWYDLGKIYIRGIHVVPEIPVTVTETNKYDDNTGYDCNLDDESDDMALKCTVMSRSKRTSDMFNNDEQHQTATQLTQESQQQDVEALMDTVGPKSQICLSILRESMNKAGDDPELIDFLIEGQKN